MFVTCPKCSARYKIPPEIDLSEGKKMQCSACQFVFEFHPEETVPVKDEPVALVPPKDAVLKQVSFKEETVVVQRKTVDEPPAVLPEAFRPLKAEDKKKTNTALWSLICFILLLLLFYFGWCYRDTLFWDAPLPLEYNQVFLNKTTRTIPPKKTQKVSPQKSVVQPEKPKPVEIEKIKKVTEDIPLDFSEMSLEKGIKNTLNVPVSEELSEKSDIPMEKISSLAIQAVRFRRTFQGEVPSVLIEGVIRNSGMQELLLPEKVYAIAYDTQGNILFEKEIYLSNNLLKPAEEQPFFGTYAPAPEGIQWVDVILKK